MSDNDEDDVRRGYRPSGGLVPIPDPTKLTLEVVALAKKEIEKLFDTKIGHVDEDIKRIEQILAEMSGIENSKRDRLRELLEQKFIGVATEFTMRDIALAAAFKAAEAAVQQQNLSTTLASEKLSGSFTKQIDNLNEKIDGLKENINEISRKNWSAVGGYIVGAVGIAALIIAAIYHSPVH
jgi:flagellar biosynthesis chaperone FliJ